MTEGLDGNKLVRVLLTLVVAGGFWKGNGRRDVLLVVKMGEWWQRAGRRDRSKGKDGVSRGRGAQTGVCFCGGFTGYRNVEFAVGQGFYSFRDTIVVNGRWGAVAVREPVGLGGGVNSDGTIDGGAVIVVGGAGTFFSSDGEVSWGDGVRVLQRRGDGETEGLWGKRRGGGDGGG